MKYRLKNEWFIFKGEIKIIMDKDNKDNSLPSFVDDPLLDPGGRADRWWYIRKHGRC